MHSSPSDAAAVDGTNATNFALPPGPPFSRAHSFFGAGNVRAVTDETQEGGPSRGNKAPKLEHQATPALRGGGEEVDPDPTATAAALVASLGSGRDDLFESSAVDAAVESFAKRQSLLDAAEEAVDKSSADPLLMLSAAGDHQAATQSLATLPSRGGQAAAAAAQLLMPNSSMDHHPASAYAQNHLPAEEAVRCAACNFAGADVRIKCQSSGRCAYHARCLDLSSLASSNIHNQNDGILITTCPNCNSHSGGLEIIPLSFAELDRAQNLGAQRRGMFLNAASQALASNSNELQMNEGMGHRKRSSADLEGGGHSAYPTNIAAACHAASNTSTSMLPPPSSLPPSTNQYDNNLPNISQCYDPAKPRTGRWTDEELAFRDAIIGHFLGGSLPLSNGLKLNDFLSNMLKSKQSRLTKKMKHAKLSTKYFRIKSGYIAPTEQAKEYSSLEYNFINVIADPVERTEISFHMQREWRDHFVERCTHLRLAFDAEEWLKSVDAMERRVAYEKNRSRMVKRRCLMGMALEKDVSESLPGVFINQKRDSDPLLDRQKHTAGAGGNNAKGGGDDDGDFGRFLMSMLDEAPIASSSGGGGPAQNANNPSPLLNATGGKKASVRSSYCDPNFRYAAPFLAGITSYIERNGVPFEHVDVWVPSTIPQGLESQTAPLMGSLGSGSNPDLEGMSSGNGDGGGKTDGAGGSVNQRLCFAGSATLGVQIINEPTSSKNDNGDKKNITEKVTSLTSDELFSFSLYGDYSEKFSFTSGCGLPGRVHASGIPAWEQFLANAPPEMFERRGGAMQFGIKTALGLPIESPNVGRIVLVLYSKHNREKDEELVSRIMKDVRLFNPCPRWKLVVDVRSSGSADPGPSPVAAQPPPIAAQLPHSMASSESLGISALSMQNNTSMCNSLWEGIGQQQNFPSSQAPSSNNFAVNDATDNNKRNQINGLVALLQENMPSDASSSPLGNQLNSLMSLRMLLLRSNGPLVSEEEHLIETILVLYESYIAAGRTRSDIALLVTRDFDFHLQHQARMVMMNQQHQQSLPTAAMTQPGQAQMFSSFNANNPQPGLLGGPQMTTLQPTLQNVIHQYQPMDIQQQLHHLPTSSLMNDHANGSQPSEESNKQG